MATMHLIKKSILFSTLCFIANAALADKRCLRIKEPTEEAILEAEKNIRESTGELGKLAHKLSKHPESNEHKERFENKSNLVIQNIEETKLAREKIKLPKNLHECEESKLNDESFNALLKKWNRIIACFPNNIDYIYNQKLLNTILTDVRSSRPKARK